MAAIFSDRVRTAAKRLGTFTARELADEIRVKTYLEKNYVSAYIKDFLLRGEMVRVNPEGPAQRAVNGRPCNELYRYVYKMQKVTNRQRLWNIVRRLPSPYFCLADLRQLTEIRYQSIKRFCIWLHDEGYAERVKPGHYRRIKEFEIDVPPDKHESDRTIALRNRKREAIKAMDRAANAIAEARAAIEEMEE